MKTEEWGIIKRTQKILISISVAGRLKTVVLLQKTSFTGFFNSNDAKTQHVQFENEILRTFAGEDLPQVVPANTGVDYHFCKPSINVRWPKFSKGGELDPWGEGEHTEAEGGERGSCCSQYSGDIPYFPIIIQVTIPISQYSGKIPYFPIFR